MTKRLGFLGITGTVSTAYIGQRALLQLADSPEFEIAGFIAEDPADVGKPLAEALFGRWQADEPLPERFAAFTLLAPEKGALQAAGLDLVISTLFAPKSKEYDPIVASAGIGVVSESVGLRNDADVPLIVPEINADHLGIIRARQKTRGYSRGFLVSSPLCTAVIIALAIKPLLDAYGLRSGIVTTLQVLSGAGKTGVAALQVIDNLIPWINGEEEKLHTEIPKILGSYRDGELTPHPAPFTTTATRVPVRDGHTASITLGLDRAPDLEAVPELIAGFRGADAAVGLPHAPVRPLVYRPEQNRPQPLLDRDRDNQLAVSVGRIRPAPSLDNGIGLVAVGHNHGRGTFGNTVLLAELILKEGLLG